MHLGRGLSCSHLSMSGLEVIMHISVKGFQYLSGTQIINKLQRKRSLSFIDFITEVIKGQYQRGFSYQGQSYLCTCYKDISYYYKHLIMVMVKEVKHLTIYFRDLINFYYLFKILDSYEEILKNGRFVLESDLGTIYLRYFSCLKIIISTFYSAIKWHQDLHTRRLHRH